LQVQILPLRPLLSCISRELRHTLRHTLVARDRGAL